MGQFDWNDIAVLASVAETGSFAKSAIQLGINQSTVSRRINRLESRLKTTLFDRKVEGVFATEDAGEFVEIAKSMSAEYARFCERANAQDRQTKRMVSLRTTEGTANYLLIPLLSGIGDGPLVQQMRTGLTGDFDWPSVDIASAGNSSAFDIGITWTSLGEFPDAKPDDRVVRLASVKFRPFFHKRYFSRTREKLSGFEDLRKHDLVSLKLYETFPSLDDWNGSFGILGGRRTAADWTTSIERCVSQGSSIGLLPAYTPGIVEEFNPLEITVPDLKLDLWIHAAVDRLKSAPVRAVFDAIIACFSVLRNG